MSVKRWKYKARASSVEYSIDGGKTWEDTSTIKLRSTVGDKAYHAMRAGTLDQAKDDLGRLWRVKNVNA
jgi:hypothetical protein